MVLGFISQRQYALLEKKRASDSEVQEEEKRKKVSNDHTFSSRKFLLTKFMRDLFYIWPRWNFTSESDFSTSNNAEKFFRPEVILLVYFSWNGY